MELIVLNLAWMFVLAVPMSVLVAVLMAFGDLSSRNEITAMRASGVSLYRMMLTPFCSAAIVALLMVMFNNYVLPESNYRLKGLMVDIRRKKPTLALENGVFSQDIPGYSMLVRRAVASSNELIGVTLYDHTNPAASVTITAQRGAISFTPDFRTLLMDLHDGEIHEYNLQQPAQYRRIRFTDHRIAMAVEGFDFERSSAGAFTRGDRELGAAAMQHIVDSLSRQYQSLASAARDLAVQDARFLAGTGPDPGPPPAGSTPTARAVNRSRQMSGSLTTYAFRMEGLNRQIDQYLVEIHKKYSIPVACIVFILVGAPLGIMSRRGGFGVAASLSLGFFILYWACLIGGEKLADRDIVSPAIGMWSANVLIGGAGAYLTMRAARETLLINWDALQRFVPQRWRTTTLTGSRAA
jgi:lipopolysaccharide export system permease protein